MKVGGSVGVFVGMNGNSYGFGIEGSVNVAKGKSNADSERWQNSHLNADKLITKSEDGGLTLEAANLKAKRWEADLQSLTLTSRQDTEKYESKQTSAGASGSIAYGSGGGASMNAAIANQKWLTFKGSLWFNFGRSLTPHQVWVNFIKQKMEEYDKRKEEKSILGFVV
ncbi:hypothetical protein BKK51_01135 [Rodentibacter trehalosifermentans]|uniref:Uncharacterized protein n=1 Tax=Rodentibacter trehalosifermentans TaxID=1908263 RepID=A0A1V3IWZ3_9PAST|nr:hemagglutinin repeat-containing protein [Rodentibacter trehalosifermentans]OOF46844.1 hypothetical protein BKK51_01135 [Rodentibacter trehalosifermentans]